MISPQSFDVKIDFILKRLLFFCSDYIIDVAVVVVLDILSERVRRLPARGVKHRMDLVVDR